MKDSGISWTTHTWNPVTGCSEVSPGCDHCYAKGIAERMHGKAFPNGFDVTLRPHKLRDPLKWENPGQDIRQLHERSVSPRHTRRLSLPDMGHDAGR